MLTVIIAEAAKKEAEETAKKAEAAAEKAAAEVKSAAKEIKSDVSKSESGLGVVKGGESGGRVLPKEEIDPAVLNMLKVSLFLRPMLLSSSVEYRLINHSMPSDRCRNTTRSSDLGYTFTRKLFPFFPRRIMHCLFHLIIQ